MKYTVIGAARSGLAAAKLAKEKGYDVFVSDSKSEEQAKYAVEFLSNENIPFELGGHTKKAFDCDEIILSPGIPPHSSIVQEAIKRSIPYIGEIEFAYRHTRNPIIAITGTNGKTTTTALIEYLLNNSGKKAVAVGNIGKAMSGVVNNIDSDTIIVAEVSSYQLEYTKDFCPDVAVLLNISPDHISWHGSFENYVESKWKISSKQSHKNLLILNADDDELQKIKPTDARIAKFGLQNVDWGICIQDKKLIINLLNKQQKEELMFTHELSLPGIHNAYNSMAAALAARAFEVSNEDIRDSLMSFKGVEHRLELVDIISGVEYVNDSKATNINATWYALSSYQKPIIWIAGGRGDNNDYSALDEFVDKNVKSIMAIGEEQQAIFDHYCTQKRVIKADSLEDAVLNAQDEADSGDVVLFTPACKSFDMFMNYEQRGEAFKEAVNKLK
jgi:UDP-N-acetylmuramoylalanine--D-glutamate ligase